MIGNQLRRLRQTRQLSQIYLAEKLGVKKQSVSNWENGNVLPSIEMLEKIADFFQVSTDYILERESPETHGVQLMDVTGLTPSQIEHVRMIVSDLRGD